MAPTYIHINAKMQNHNFVGAIKVQFYVFKINNNNFMYLNYQYCDNYIKQTYTSYELET